MMIKISAELNKLGVRDLGEREVKVVFFFSKKNWNIISSFYSCFFRLPTKHLPPLILKLLNQFRKEHLGGSFWRKRRLQKIFMRLK